LKDDSPALPDDERYENNRLGSATSTPESLASSHSQQSISTAPLGCCMLRCWRVSCFERLSECMLASIQLSARVFPVNSKLRAPVGTHFLACVAPRISETFLVSAGRQCNVSLVGCVITSRKNPPLARLVQLRHTLQSFRLRQSFVSCGSVSKVQASDSDQSQPRFVTLAVASCFCLFLGPE